VQSAAQPPAPPMAPAQGSIQNRTFAFGSVVVWSVEWLWLWRTTAHISPSQNFNLPAQTLQHAVTAGSEPDRSSFRHFFPQSLFQQSEQLRPALADWPQVTDFHRHSQPAAGRPHAMAVDDGVAPHGRPWGRCREVVAPRAGSRGADGRATMLQHGLQAQGQLRVQEVSTARRAVRYVRCPHTPHVPECLCG
jgi:hypothetical protein